ncbi:MAG: pilus assembly protein PilM [Kiritimatiellales bacterium]|nr:pilus assembly protein PilM [Pontiella sp.]NNJ70131.1 pilus assembly protein PilM [Kiritimatiellales bacterium]
MMMNAFGKNRTQRKLSVLVGVDFAATATKVVQLKQLKGELTLTGIDMLPAVDFNTTASRMELPRNLSSYYGCLAYSGAESVVRMVHTPLPAGEETVPESELRKLLNVTDDFRVSAQLIKRGKGRQDSSLLAAAIPQDDVRYLLNLFPAGPPAPASLEVAGLAFVSAFLNARGAECANDAVCLIDAGESVSHYVFMNKGAVVLVGKMDFGVRALRSKLATDLGVDDELAASILDDRSINISTSLANVMAPIIKQLSISKDFIERHQGCRVSRVYVSGGMSLLPSWSDELMNMIHTEVESWSPLENIAIAPEILSPELKQQATRFAAAIGAAIGGFQES